jgi:Calcineurin-like phosphoesterase
MIARTARGPGSLIARMINAAACIVAGLLLSAAAPAPAKAQWDQIARVVVIGDLHGNYAKFHAMLTTAGLIDARNNWVGGAAHLVQLGDVPDRAPDTRRILDLLMRIEAQARRAGGQVHSLIGNHEVMAMEGDLRYTTPGEYTSFADRDSARRRDAYYKRFVAAVKAQPPAGGVPVFDAAYRARFDAEHPLGWVEHRLAWSLEGQYGRWIMGHSAIIRIDDTLYLHAGIAPEFRQFDIAALNEAVLAALRHQPERTGGPPDILWNEVGPLWYRGMAQGDEAANSANVMAVLSRYGVRRVVIGHSKQYTMVNSRFEGGVILMDIAAPAGCAEPAAFMVKEGDVITAFHRGQRLSFGVTGAAHAKYLSEVAALDRAAGCRAP